MERCKGRSRAGYPLSFLRMAMNIKKERVTPVYYPKSEELFSAILHGIGALFGIAALWVTMVLSIRSGNKIALLASIIYGVSLIVTYTLSTLSHALSPKGAKKVFRVLDHSAIFLLIAGTYTPVTLLILKGAFGWVIFGIQWIIAILGILFNSIALNRFKKLSLIIYTAMGWLIIIAAFPLLHQMAPSDLLYLLGGGIFYTAGAVFYRIGKPGMHAIWHLFALVGSILQFFAIYSYLQ